MADKKVFTYGGTEFIVPPDATVPDGNGGHISLSSHLGMSSSDVDAAKLEMLRDKRNELIAETDWMAGQDRTMTQAERDYRQALRDITDTYSNLDDVVWPTKP
jgi:hypothetical protein